MRYVTDGVTSATMSRAEKTSEGAIAQLGERLPCTQEVSGSIPLSSTNSFSARILGGTLFVTGV